MSAFVRDPSRLPAEVAEQVNIICGNATLKSDVDGAVSGHDSVIVALGTGHDLSPTTAMSDGLRNVLDAMTEQGIGKVSVCLSSFLFWEPERVPARFAQVHADHKRMLDLLGLPKYKPLHWVAVLPPQIANEPSSNGAYTVSHGSGPGRQIPKWDLGHFMVTCLDQEQHYHQLCGLAYPVAPPPS